MRDIDEEIMRVQPAADDIEIRETPANGKPLAISAYYRGRLLVQMTLRPNAISSNMAALRESVRREALRKLLSPE
ncbi:MAG: hypothetical protein PHO92_00735 [Candidatus Peribacteraceae bacterium]|nr:hypothetical protein [Candidatus Peribacteraceae bacterium]